MATLVRARARDGASPDHRLHHHVLEIGQELLIRGLGHRDGDQLLLAIDPEVRAEQSAPAEAAGGQERVARDWIVDDTDAEAEALAAWAAWQRVGREHRSHQFDGARTQIALPVQFAV